MTALIMDYETHVMRDIDVLVIGGGIAATFAATWRRRGAACRAGQGTAGKTGNSFCRGVVTSASRR
jgi:hypothetical protein